MAEESQELQELYIVVGRNSEGKEGVASYVDPRDGVMKPALGGRDRAGGLIEIAQALANESGLSLTMTKWGRIENLEMIEPEKPGDD
jgi:hypothetical protein